MVFEKLPAAVGIGGVSVELVTHQDSTHPGGSVGGFLRLQGGRERRDLTGVLVEFVAGVRGGRPGAGADGAEFLPFHRTLVRDHLSLAPGQVVDLPFTAGVPFEAPISVLGGRHLPGTRLGLRARFETAGGGGATGAVPVALRALPVQQRLLCAVERLGFPLRAAICVDGQVPDARQRLPFRQEVEFGPSAHYRDARGLRVTFVTDERGVDVRVEITGRPEVARVSTPHTAADSVDWAAEVRRLVGPRTSGAGDGQ
ncbi:sporulation protein [Streptoalloteichus hindustanus]|uniref:Sporulation-control protein n=1 Tax=Streptoalloteichus hindustanus TaxID=2017 RepID=A0A1M4UWS1_STRHI|nr:sporulation protein [Streptoalloteichus hindustanus]SHE61073.1 sporulation-control protein [Streptoalloteichus hindustanus]